MPISTDPNTVNAYRAAYRAGQQMAMPVDAMRWQTQYFYALFRGRAALRDAERAEVVKLGFADGFAAGQDQKARRFAGRMRPVARLAPTMNFAGARN